MPAIDYVFDSSAEKPENRIVGEIHSLADSVGVIPIQGGFYRKGLTVIGIAEAESGGNLMETLIPDRDFYFSPLFIRPSAVGGNMAHSYLMIRGDWDAVSLTYQCVGGEHGEDLPLLNKVANSQFDRRQITEWLTITGAESYHPRTRDPQMGQTAEIEILNDGLGRIVQALSNLPGGADKATNQQVTDLEIRQSTLEGRQDGLDIEFDDIQLEFYDLRELYYYLKGLIEHGREGHYTENGGYVYKTTDPLSVHTVIHNLDTLDIDVTVWGYDETDGRFHHVQLVNTVQLDTNRIQITALTPVNLMVIVRPVTVDDGGYIYEGIYPDTIHNIDHNLNSGFLSATVWVENDQGQFEWAVTASRMIDPDRMTVTLNEARRVRVVLQRPLPNAFIYKSHNAKLTHELKHELMTHDVGVTVWVQDDDGGYVSAIQSTTLHSKTDIATVVNEPRFIKVVVQPALVKDTSFEQHVNQSLTILEDRQDQLELLMQQFEGVLENVNDFILNDLIGEYTYESDSPMLIHSLNHNLGKAIPDVTVWVQGDDGNYYNDSVKVRLIDDDNLAIVLGQARHVKARVSGI